MNGSSAPTRVLVVDDSALFRKLVRGALQGIPGVDVVGEAPNGAVALELVDSLAPDLMTLDVEMPVLDGLGVLRGLQERSSAVRVIMFSTLTRIGTETTVRSLCLGASDFLLKPQATSTAEAMAQVRGEFERKIAALFPAPALPSPRPQPTHNRSSAPVATPYVLGIGVSTGGPKALNTLFRDLPPDFPLPVVVVQHMPAGFTEMLARSLNEVSALSVSEARSGMPLEPGVALIAPGGQHLEIRAGSGQAIARVTESPPERSCRPSANVLLRSLARHYGASTLALIMTGVGDDGLEGCRAVAAQGGTVLAQDEASSAVYGMPKCVVEDGLAHHVCALDELGQTLSILSGGARAAARG